MALLVKLINPALFVMMMLAFCVPARSAELFVAVGEGVTHTDHAAAQVSLAFPSHVELHVSWWDGVSKNRAHVAGYRFELSPPLSVMLGISWLRHETRNVAQGWNGASELRLRFDERWACQLTHYSGAGSDPSDNMILCGLFHSL